MYKQMTNKPAQADLLQRCALSASAGREHEVTESQFMALSHFCAEATDSNDGLTWTLTTRLGAILFEVEQLYGARDLSWTILGVEFGPDAPQIWYPGNRKHIAIRLASNALESTPLACYQLAHECVHLLAPGGISTVPVIEEGLATVFSEDYVVRELGLKVDTNMPSYRAAAALVREMLRIDPNAIQSLRAIEPAFRKITRETFDAAGVLVPLQLQTQLLVPFQRE